jgi:hypothetical protein
MSRFYSEHEIKKKDIQLMNDDILNTFKYKNDLKDALNRENHRINIDSAKKKAVLQGMDYDGFHQMVLGADIKGIKTQELQDLKPSSTIVNSVFIPKKLSDPKDIFQRNFVGNEKINKKEVTSINNSQTDLNFNTFQKNWKKCSNNSEKLALLLNITPRDYFYSMLQDNILESDLFLDLIINIGMYILENKELENEKLLFLLKCLEKVIQHKNYQSLKKFLGKKHKGIYDSINLIKNDIFKNEEEMKLFDAIWERIK